MLKTQILVVEDEYIVAKDIKNSLEKLGYSVPAIASSGEEALRKVDDEHPDLVLMDIVLKGGMDGIQTASEIKAKYNVPVIYVTAYADDKTLSRAKVTEPFGYLIKPFEERDLYSNIEMALYKQKMENKLKESEERYRMLFENLNVGVYRVTPGPEGEFIDVNPAFVKILDYKNKNEILNLRVSDIYVNPENRAVFNTKISKTGFVSSEEIHLKRNDGTPIIASDTGIAVYDKNGEIKYFDGILEDITHRRQMETALSESEERYRRLVEHFPLPMIVLSEGKLVFINPSTVDLMGAASIEELIGRPLTDFVHPDDHELVSARSHEIEVGVELSTPIVMKLIRLDGQIKNVELIEMPITYQNKPAAQVVFRDITEPKEIEKELRESEEKYRNLVERANDGIVIIQDGIIKFVNPRLEKITGYKPEEFIDKPFKDYLHPDEVTKVVNYYKKRMAGGTVPEIYESAALHKDGSKINIEINGGVITYQDKPADLVIIRDITERKLAEEELRKNEERFRLLTENVSDIIVWIDPSFKLLDVTPSCEQFSGYKREELIGKSFKELNFLTKDTLENMYKNIKRVMAGDQPPFTEYEFITKDGRKRKTEVRSAPIFKDGKLIEVIAIIRDVTDRKLKGEL